jgi:hypothetical protein
VSAGCAVGGIEAVGAFVAEGEGMGEAVSVGGMVGKGVAVAGGTAVQEGWGVFNDGWNGVAVASPLGVTSTKPVEGCGSVVVMVAAGAQELINREKMETRRKKSKKGGRRSEFIEVRSWAPL